MVISAINNSFVSFKRRHENKNVSHSNAATAAKILLPALLLFGSPTLQSTANSDTFEYKDIPEEFNDFYSTKTASTLGVSTTDYYIKRALKDKTITLDPGHGGTYKQKTTFSDPYGAKYYDYKNKKWVYEKDITIKISKEVEKLLKEAGANIVMTRDSDNYVTLDERTQTSKDAKSNMFVSIHVNANQSRKVRGPEVWLCSKTSKTDAAKEGQKLAQKINNRMMALYGIEEDGIKYKNFNVLEGTKNTPGLLVEIGYLSNTQDRKIITDEEQQMKLAKDIAGSIVEFWVEKQLYTDTADLIAENTKQSL